ncbi:hypothetical protein NMY22_g2030 [Coprinellus aureogranulatus]|nr:hypothetical protein NMY22_g2030 [Coprinellus aureogranulatus]
MPLAPLPLLHHDHYFPTAWDRTRHFGSALTTQTMKYGPRTAVLWLALLTISAFEVGTAQVIEGATECVEARGFHLCQNLAVSATGSNYQRSTALRAAANSIAWSTEYSWEGSSGQDVKSFANVESKAATALQLNMLPYMTTVWNWKYESRTESLKAVVALDIQIGSAKGRAADSKAKSFRKDMASKCWKVRLITQADAHRPALTLRDRDAHRIQPFGSKIDEAECIAGYDWFVWRAVAGGVQTITFVNQEPNEDITSFDGDIGEFICLSGMSMGPAPTFFSLLHRIASFEVLIALPFHLFAFLDYLIETIKLPETYYIQSVQAGNEVYGGTATFHTFVFQLWVEYPAE